MLLRPSELPLVFLSWFSVLLLVRGLYHHVSIAGGDPTSWFSFVLFLRLFWFVACFLLFVLFVGFACLFLWFVCVFGFLLGLHTGLRTGPSPVLLWLSTIDSLAR